MATTLTLHAMEEGTYMIVASFTDENNRATIPTELAWTLTNRDGSIVNARDEVVVTPASSVTIVLYGDDLAGHGLKVFIIEGMYDSDEGLNLPLKGVACFTTDDIKILPRQ